MVLLAIHVTLKVSLNQNIQSNAIALLHVFGILRKALTLWRKSHVYLNLIHSDKNHNSII